LGEPYCFYEGKVYDPTDLYPSGIYWPTGSPCAKYCTAKVEYDWCGTFSGGETCRSCVCGNGQFLNPADFDIGPGETRQVTAYYVPGNCSDPSTARYTWYDFPVINSSAITSQCLACGIDYVSPDISGWSYDVFTAGASGYVNKVELIIKNQMAGYLNFFIGENTGQLSRLSDNRGQEDGQLYGGREVYYEKLNNCGDRTGCTERKITADFKYLTTYIEAGEQYKLYYKPRTVESFTLKDYWISVAPSNGKVTTGTFSPQWNDPPSCRGKSQCTITYTAPNAPVGTRFKLLAEISDNKSLFTGPFGSANCIGTVNIVPGNNNWFQTQDIDVYSRLNIQSRISSDALPANRYFSLKGTGGYPGVVVYGGTNVDFGAGTVSPDYGWLANDLTSRLKSDYQYLLNRLRVNQEAPLADNRTLESITESGVYYVNTGRNIGASELIPSLTQTWTIGANKQIVIFVDGYLNINQNIVVPSTSFLAIIVNGDITFSKGVSKAQGWFVADKEIVINGAAEADPAGDKVQFLGEGAFIGWEGVTLNRILDSIANPAEKFVSRPEFWLNAPEAFRFSQTYREELLP